MEWEFFLAERLRKTVASLRSEMSNAEFEQWRIYYSRKAQLSQIGR